MNEIRQVAEDVDKALSTVRDLLVRHVPFRYAHENDGHVLYIEGLSTDRVEAPFTPDQVASLNGFQAERSLHPFTCGKCPRKKHGDGILVASDKGWTCPTPGCDYAQTWAHAFMANWQWKRISFPFKRTVQVMES